MTRPIRIGKGFKVGKSGKVEKSIAHFDVSRRLKAKGSRKIKPVRRTTPR